jgi:group II intron reverse transcriptase/maturase
MRNVAGLSTSEAQKSSDLFMKCRYMDELTGNRGVVFATGTPISNSMTEMYTMQRYLQYDTLVKNRLTHFDCWASIFGETVTSIELAPEGNGYRARTRFARFHNLPELMAMFKDVADIKTADMLNLPVPQAHYETVIVEPSDLQKEMVQELSERAAEVHAHRVDSLKGKTFIKLMEIISSEENIRLAYRNIKKNGGSTTAGTDGHTIKDIENMPVEKYVQAVQRKLQFYQPKPVRRVLIPKPNGKMRPLGIPCMIDRLVQQSILQVMEPICEAKFFERSNGFRPNRSAEHALAQCYKMIQLQKLHYVVDVDIKGFFDNVNHSKLIKQIWHLGIRDKKLLCIIKEMLKAPIVMPDGTKEFPTKGTPQGGVLSPLLSNIVLNELDWWIASQWEEMPTEYEYSCEIRPNGTKNKSTIYGALRNSTTLKEVYIVRYADDFKLFCRTKSDAEKVLVAVKQWLKDRLKLEVSEEKSKITNLKRHYSEFLGFELKAVKKRKKYVVRSHMTPKAISNAKTKLVEQIKRIAHTQSNDDEAKEVTIYNSMVIGIHNYYCHATMVSTDCEKINWDVQKVMKNRLYSRLKRTGKINEVYLRKQYGKSKQIRFVSSKTICPVGYIKTKNPMFKKKSVYKYTADGREEVHKSLKINTGIMLALMRMVESRRSIEYMDNRISLYAAQYGKPGHSSLRHPF